LNIIITNPRRMNMEKIYVAYMMKLEKTYTLFWLANCRDRQHFGDL
jgi:hypothetical protein